jgi:hypothetical protein
VANDNVLDLEKIDWDSIFKQVEQKRALKELRGRHRYVADLISVLVNCPASGLSKRTLDDLLLRKRKEAGLPIPEKFSETVQSVLNGHTSQSAVFLKSKKGPEEDLFYSPRGKGSGTWAVHQERAISWLEAHTHSGSQA